MKNKTLIITNIIILCCIVIGLLIFMIFGINGKITFWGDEASLVDTKNYKDTNINNVVVNVKSYDIKIEPSNSNDIEIEIYGNEKIKNNTSIENSNGILNISQKKSTLCFGFCYNSKLVIKLPTSYSGKYNINTISGDVEFKLDLKNTENNISTTSGDIYLTNILKGNINSTSGEIKINSLSDGKVKTTSGDISIDKLGNGDITSTSGEIEIERFAGFGDITTNSGDIRLNNFEIEGTTNINSVSGEVRIKLLNEAYITATSTSGDKDIKNSRGEYELKIKTVSGDIRVK